VPSRYRHSSTARDTLDWVIGRADIHHDRCRAARTGDYCVACLQHEQAVSAAIREAGIAARVAQAGGGI